MTYEQELEVLDLRLGQALEAFALEHRLVPVKNWRRADAVHAVSMAFIGSGTMDEEVDSFYEELIHFCPEVREGEVFLHFQDHWEVQRAYWRELQETAVVEGQTEEGYFLDRWDTWKLGFAMASETRRAQDRARARAAKAEIEGWLNASLPTQEQLLLEECEVLLAFFEE